MKTEQETRNEIENNFHVTEEMTTCDDCEKDISLHTYYATGGLCVACSMS